MHLNIHSQGCTTTYNDAHALHLWLPSPSYPHADGTAGVVHVDLPDLSPYFAFVAATLRLEEDHNSDRSRLQALANVGFVGLTSATPSGTMGLSAVAGAASPSSPSTSSLAASLASHWHGTVSPRLLAARFVYDLWAVQDVDALYGGFKLASSGAVESDGRHLVFHAMSPRLVMSFTPVNSCHTVVDR